MDVNFCYVVNARIILWGKQKTFDNLVLRVRASDPEDGCEPYSFNEPHHATAFVATGLKKCSLTHLIHNAQAHGAKALFIVNNKDSNLEEIDVPDHISGVGIHVLLVSHSDGKLLLDIAEQARTEDKDWHSKSRVEIDFLEYVQKSKSIDIQMVFTPDDEQAVKFLSDLYSSPFAGFIGKYINLRLNYALLHCDSCKKDGFKLPVPDCLSGGRYCMQSAYFDNLGGDLMLVQALKNICTEKVLRRDHREYEIGDYYYLYEKNCFETFSFKCVNQILKRMGIKNAVMDCIYDSFESTAYEERRRFNSDKRPNINLQDNSLLRDELTNFKTVQHYSDFPLIKINNVYFYGSPTYLSVFGFICRHINDGFSGCNTIITEEEIKINRNSKVFQFSVLALIGLLVSGAVFVCQKRMKKRFDVEMAYKVDQSVTEFLQKDKTGPVDPEDPESKKPVNEHELS